MPLAVFRVRCIPFGETESAMARFKKNTFPFSSIVVTGASSGIGKAFIAMSMNLGKIGRVCNLSRSVPADLPPGVPLLHVPCDLADPRQVQAGAQAVLRHLREADDGPVLLINNSGFGSFGPFSERDLDHQLSMIDVNVRAMVQMTGLLLPLLRERGGAVMNIASTAAWQPTPYMATYGATKAFVLSWSLALHEDLRRDGVHVIAVCPGPTESNFHRRAGFDAPPIEGWGETAEAVARKALRALMRQRTFMVSGTGNKCVAALACRLPKAWQAPIAAAVLRRFRLERHQRARQG